MLAGILVTLVASLRPALRATRVPPIAAVREGATLPPGRFARFRPGRALVTTILGFAALIFGLFGPGSARPGSSSGWASAPCSSSSACRCCRRSSCGRWPPVLGWPAARLGGVAGALARDNSRRNPERTASTASALMIGLALVTLVAVLAAGITTSFRGAVDDLWNADYAITAQNNFSPIPISAADAAAKVPGVTAVANVRVGDAKVFGSVDQATAVNPDAARSSTQLGGRLARPSSLSSATTASSSRRAARRTTT